MTADPKFRLITLAALAALWGSSAGAAEPLLDQPALAAPQTYRQAGGQPLAQALNELALRLSIALSFDPVLTEGLKSPALAGRLSAREALARLLAGSGLEIAARSDGSFTLRRSAAAAAPSAEADALPLVRGRASAESRATSEGTGSYAALAVSLGKLEQRPRDIPQSLSVLTRQQLDDRNLASLDEAMRNVTGISVETSSTGGNHGNFYARGYALDTVQIDGVVTPASTGSDLSTGFSMAVYDRVEVLRGPAGLLQGAGDPGGSINLVRKRASKEFAASYELFTGSWRRHEARFDVGGSLNETGSVRGRLVAAYQDRHSFVDHVNSRKPLVYGTAAIDLDARTTLSAGLTYQQYKGRPAFGLPAYEDGSFLEVPRSTNVDPAWSHINEELKEYFGEIEHRLENGGRARLSLVHREQDEPSRKFGWADCSVDRTSGDSCLISWIYRSHWKTQGADAFVSSPFEAFGRRHQLTLGADYRRVSKAFQYGGGDGAYVNVYRPDNRVPEPSYTFDNGNNSKTTQYGAYARAHLQLADRLQLALGGRLSWWERSEQNRNAYFNQFSDTHTEVKHKFTPLAGLVYTLNDSWSAYASYTSIFSPQTASDFQGRGLAPRTGKQFELGLKAELFDKQANAHVALFRMEDVNRATTDPDHLRYSIAAGKMRSEGLEAEITGRLLPRWDLSAGYAFNYTATLSGTDEEKRRLYSYIAPRHTLHLWSKYGFGPGALDGFSVGAGLRALSSTYRLAGDVKFEQRPYALASLQLGYRFGSGLEAALTIENLFDKVYYQRVWAAFGSNYYGEPRNAMLSLRGKF
ncbi:TonB-dependent siderophore receptor [Roseateles sp. DAIF2]|uniref:TonB-dependent siderophore receptor n=1 Tax=Roseateles sp. DAIF2 TaxID=2714952 RepID=UPI0018A29445|nr:TonB-dependent receptor [Roseateles sp. DAIF2]QPF73258.1 TonB-dependent siderophore receptor [Roseateles sp. DAIF2]